MDIQINSIINVQSYKQDGTLYKQYNGLKVIEITNSWLVLYAYKTKVAEAQGSKWVMREPMLWFFNMKNKFYNTTASLKPAGVYYYTNLASPFIYEDNVIKYIDYDLDIKWYPNAKVKVIDKNEFRKHIKEMNYPQELINIINITTNNVLNLIHNKEDIFSKSLMFSYITYLKEQYLLPKKFYINF